MSGSYNITRELLIKNNENDRFFNGFGYRSTCREILWSKLGQFTKLYTFLCRFPGTLHRLGLSMLATMVPYR